MNDKNRSEKVMAIKNSVDFDTVADNMLEIAEFTVEKYEFRNAVALSDDARQEAIAKIREVLWQKIEELKQRRKKALEEMFGLAEKTLDDSMVGKE